MHVAAKSRLAWLSWVGKSKLVWGMFGGALPRSRLILEQGHEDHNHLGARRPEAVHTWELGQHWEGPVAGEGGAEGPWPGFPTAGVDSSSTKEKMKTENRGGEPHNQEITQT